MKFCLKDKKYSYMYPCIQTYIQVFTIALNFVFLNSMLVQQAVKTVTLGTFAINFSLNYTQKQTQINNTMSS